MNLSIKRTSLFVSFLLIVFLTLQIYPINSIQANAVEGVQTLELVDEDNNVDVDKPPSGDDMLPKVDTDEFMNHAEKKVYEVVRLLQVIGKPFCIVAFIICAILTLAGTFGRSAYVMKGVVGMLVCAIAYACILFSPQIVNFFSTWIVS